MEPLHPPADAPKMVFLFSDTGGGHRSACEAIIEALNLEYPSGFRAEMVDIFRQYAPPPLGLAPDIYPTLSRMPEMWGLGYRASNGPRRTRMMNSMLWPYVRRSINKLVVEHPCDLLVSVHQLSNAPFLQALEHRRALGNPKIPFVSVVTDMVTTHAFWYDRRADLVIVPTEAARERGLRLGLDPRRMRVVGMPVAERFARPQGEKAEIRARLGWPQDRPVALLVGGGEGMGPLEAICGALDERNLPLTLAVVTGRNKKLKRRLETRRWNSPPVLYGFVRNMPELMAAADVLVTKAGPGTISEAFIAGLPMILYSKMPGQEDGNVTYVVEEGAGVWAPDPRDAATALSRWVLQPEQREQVAAASRALARPHASREIARLLAGMVYNFHHANP